MGKLHCSHVHLHYTAARTPEKSSANWAIQQALAWLSQHSARGHARHQSHSLKSPEKRREVPATPLTNAALPTMQHNAHPYGTNKGRSSALCLLEA